MLHKLACRAVSGLENQSPLELAGCCVGVLGARLWVDRGRQYEVTTTYGRVLLCLLCSVLGMGLLPAIDHAARFLLAPAARVVPHTVQARQHAECRMHCVHA